MEITSSLHLHWIRRAQCEVKADQNPESKITKAPPVCAQEYQNPESKIKNPKSGKKLKVQNPESKITKRSHRRPRNDSESRIQNPESPKGMPAEERRGQHPESTIQGLRRGERRVEESRVQDPEVRCWYFNVESKILKTRSSLSLSIIKIQDPGP